MLNGQIRVLNKVPVPPPPVNQFMLKVECMSGDADEYKTQTYHHPLNEPEEFAKYVQILGAFFRLNWNEGCDEARVKCAIHSMAKELDLCGQEAVEWYTDLVGGDVTSNGEYLRRPMSMNTYMYDEHGNQFEIQVLDQNHMPIKSTRY
jgi:hypothetical protein